MHLIVLLIVLLAAAPALADDAHLEHDTAQEQPVPDPTPSPAPTATPTPTALPPLCSESGPLVRCLAVQDPAAVLNQRVTQLEQRDSQIIGAFNEIAKKVDALASKPRK